MKKRKAAKHIQLSVIGKRGSPDYGATPYDDAFQTLVHDCPRLLIPLINETFGKKYTGNEQIIRHPNDQYLNVNDEGVSKRISDSVFSIVGEDTEDYLTKIAENSPSS